MDKKKKIIIIVAVIVIAVFLYLSRNERSYQEMMDHIETTVAGKTGKDVQEAMEAVVQSEEDNAYNVARQKFYGAAGKYPPASWSLDQINEAINNWTQIRSYLTTYSQYMGKMDRVSEAKKEAEKCYDLATAERLATAAKEEYSVYQKKEKIYNEIVTICKQYGISVADLGVKDFKSDTETALNNALTKAHEIVEKATIYNEIVSICKQYGISAADLGVKSLVTDSKVTMSNALTKAKQLGSLRSRYDELNKYCQAAGLQISKYIGSEKWYNVLTSTYDSAIATVKILYIAVIESEAQKNVKALWANLNPYRYGMVSLDSFRDRPYEAQNYLDPSLFQSAVDFCAKSADHLRLWKAAFQAEHQDYPVFVCQMRPHWPYFDTLAGLMITCIEHSGGGRHLTRRDNWAEVEAIYNKKQPPLVD